MLKTARSYLHSSGHNTGSWRKDGRTDRQTKSLQLVQRSALRAMRTRCKNRTRTCSTREHLTNRQIAQCRSACHPRPTNSTINGTVPLKTDSANNTWHKQTPGMVRRGSTVRRRVGAGVGGHRWFDVVNSVACDWLSILIYTECCIGRWTGISVNCNGS